MAPVDAKVTVGRHGTAILIGGRRAHRQSQGIGVVVCVQGNIYPLGRVFRPDLVIGCIDPGSIVHAVVGNP